jgi:hypothetical protein
MRPQDWLTIALAASATATLHLSAWQRAARHEAEHPEDVLGWALICAGFPEDQHHRCWLVLAAERAVRGRTQT